MPYSQTLKARGGYGSYSWSISAGSLPAGLKLTASTGITYGRPGAAGIAQFTVHVKDSLGGTATKALSLKIYRAVTITSNSPLPNGEVGIAYSKALAAARGMAPYTWSIQTGSLPAGLSLNAATGVVSGSPITASGPTAITFKEPIRLKVLPVKRYL